MTLPSKLRSEEFGGRTFFAPINDTISFRQRFSTSWHIDKCLEYTKGRKSVVQAGGNLGQWPIYLANIFDTVWTFEPSPINFQCLCLNTNGIENIIRIPLGLSYKNVVATLHEDLANCEGTYLEIGNGSTPLVSLDRVYPIDNQLDLLLLDLEGMEEQAILGAENTIRSTYPTILLENRQFDRLTFDMIRLNKTLIDWGYELVATASKDLIYVHNRS